MGRYRTITFYQSEMTPIFNGVLSQGGGRAELYRNIVTLFIQSLLLTFTLVVAYHKLNFSKEQAAI